MVAHMPMNMARCEHILLWYIKKFLLLLKSASKDSPSYADSYIEMLEHMALHIHVFSFCESVKSSLDPFVGAYYYI